MQRGGENYDTAHHFLEKELNFKQMVVGPGRLLERARVQP